MANSGPPKVRGSVAQTHLKSYAGPERRGSIPLDIEPPDKDTLHRLPLEGLPLVTEGLRSARLVKNSRFEGVIELFTEEKTGSGQVAPSQLSEVFEFGLHNQFDLDLIKHLSQLNSYDVYTVRLALRRLGVEVEDVEVLRLSEDLRAQLAPHMAGFTRPLLQAVYGDKIDQPMNTGELLSLFVSPDVEVARKNLQRLADTLHIDVTALPRFIEDYGDVFLSLAYYKHCLEQSRPQILSFFNSMDEMRNSKSLQSSIKLMSTCKAMRAKVGGIVQDVSSTLDMFRIRTADMWENMSDESFRKMEDLIIGYQVSIGAALCIVTVKMNAWSEQFPQKESGGPWSRAEFLMTSMRPGLEMAKDISYADVG